MHGNTQLKKKQQTVVNEAMNLDFRKMQYCSLSNCQLLLLDCAACS
jgi:hypothetical protein